MICEKFVYDFVAVCSKQGIVSGKSAKKLFSHGKKHRCVWLFIIHKQKNSYFLFMLCVCKMGQITLAQLLFFCASIIGPSYLVILSVFNIMGQVTISENLRCSNNYFLLTLKACAVKEHPSVLNNFHFLKRTLTKRTRQ